MPTPEISETAAPPSACWTLLYDANFDGEIELLRSHLARSAWSLTSAESATTLIAKAQSLKPHVILVSDQTPAFWRALEELVAERDVHRKIILNASPATSPEHQLALTGAGVRVLVNMKGVDLAMEIARLLELRTRAATRVFVEFDLHGRSGLRGVFRGRGVDVSTGGICLRTNQELAAGDVVHCFFTLALDPHQIFATGKIVHCRQTATHYEYGVEFSDIGMQDRLRIADFVLHQAVTAAA